MTDTGLARASGSGQVITAGRLTRAPATIFRLTKESTVMFTENEMAYLKSQGLARIATVAPDGQPDASPVGFEFDGAHFYVGGHDLTNTRKYRNVQAGHRKVALIIDDLQSIDPWRPRAIRIYGLAELVERQGRLGPGMYIRITPLVSWSWGIEGPSSRKTVHTVLHETRR